ncbi:MAG: BTAD domain-containing putative transcriptional regulator [Streptosporangiales bacterium]
MLGPLEVQVDGEWSGIGAAKWRTVLAVLLVNAPQLVSTPQLIEEVWPSNPPATATNLVSVYVHRLRKQLGDGQQLLVTRSPGYQLLAAPEDIDAQRFAALVAEGRAALAGQDALRAAELLGEAGSLWQGTRALADVPSSSPLVSAEASRLEECRVEALELRIQADLGCGRHAQVVPELHRLLTDYPLREKLWGLLMQALCTSGRQAEALEAYAKARQLIADELGVDPGAELRLLHERILRADAGTSPPPFLTDGAAGSRRDGAPAAALGTPAPAGQPDRARHDRRDGDDRRNGPGGRPSGDSRAAAAALPRPADTGPGHPSRAALPLLAQLPADIPDFTGRADHLDNLRDLLSGPRRPDSPGAVVVAAVIGAGGLGKTTLAVHAAHLLRAHYPDGQLYANLQGASQHPATPGDVLARFLRDLGMEPGRIPVDPEERAAAYRSRLTERKVLIVLDDARDAAHVRPLLPGSSSCAVLVTTRNRMPDLAGSRLVDLDVLEPTEAGDMFAGIIGRARADAEPEATREVLTACAGLPLAIRIAGARLAARSSWTVRNLARRLSDERRRLDELTTGDLAVRACFEVSFASLTGWAGPDGVEPAHAFRLLGLWQGPSIGLPAAAALIGQPEDAVADALEVLVDAQLLQSPAPDRYRYHDLLKTYAADRALAEEQQQARDRAVRRVLCWYLCSVVAAARVLSPHREQVSVASLEPGCDPAAFSSVAEALDWCELERMNLVAATQQAAAQGLDDIAWELPVAALSFFNRRTYWDEWMVTHQIALDSARRTGDQHGEAWVLNNLGMACFEAGRRIPEGLTYFQQALDIRRKIGDRQGEAQAANNVAYASLLLSRLDEALDWLRLALDLQREVGHRFGEGIALNNLGEAYIELGRPDVAVEWLAQALAVYREIGATPPEADTLSNLGKAHAALGQLNLALGYLREAEETHHAVGDRHGEAMDLKQLGEVHCRDGRLQEAREAWAQSLAIFETLGNEEQRREVSMLVRALGDDSAA